LAQLGRVTGIDLSESLLEEAKNVYDTVIHHDILSMSTALKGKQLMW